MSTITIKKADITGLAVDAVVNAANDGLREGGGVCGAIFRKAGSAELTAACRKYGHCDVGSAVITPGFRLKAKYIIHAVGPRWIDGRHKEPSQLYDAYKSSLELAKENGCTSIGFPLISSGIFGYPKDGAWRKAIQACTRFIEKNPDYNIDIVFAVRDDNILALGQQTLDNVRAANESSLPADEPEKEISLTPDLDQKAADFFKRNLNLLRAIVADSDMRQCFQNLDFSKHPGLMRFLTVEFSEKAYQEGIIIPEYDTITSGMDSALIMNPTAEFVQSLSKLQIIACVSFQFRADHFSNGSLEAHSIGKGALIPYFEAYLEK